MPDNIFIAVLVTILCNKIIYLVEVWIVFMDGGTPRILNSHDACEALDYTNSSFTLTTNGSLSLLFINAL